MKTVIALILCILTLPLSVSGQHLFQLSGVVLDHHDEPLPGAYVIITPGKYKTSTDKNGFFTIRSLKQGDYSVQVSFIGYETVTIPFSIIQDHHLVIHLKQDIQSLKEVVVEGNHEKQRKKEESLNIEIINHEFLRQNLGGSLMQSLERLPGISTIDIGSGQSKPVIRGLSFNRIVIIENGVKHEGQQWGADHGLEVDQFAVEQIEIIKGPSSIIYGSDAIGGVIDLNQAKPPEENTFGGSVDLVGKSNNNQVGSSLYLFARKQKLYFTLRGTLLDYGDYKVPADSVTIYSYYAHLHNHQLRNTAGNEKNFHFTVGTIQKAFSDRLSFSFLSSKSGFFANAHGLEPRDVDTELHDQSNRDIQEFYQQVRHLKIINKSEWILSKIKVSSEFGLQRNFRQEVSPYVQHGYMPETFPDTLSFSSDLEREFDKYTLSGNARLEYQSNQMLLKTGINAEYQHNKIGGRGFIIPAFQQFSAGLFIYGKYAFTTQSMIHAGIRYDYGSIQTEHYFDWFQSPLVEDNDTTWEYLQRAMDLNRSFNNISGSIGYNLTLGELLLKLNIGRSFRMPIAKELAANGVNYHRFSYEKGDSSLSPETAFQFDAGLEFLSDHLELGLSPFITYFTNYIYLNPSSEHDRLYGNGNQVYYYTQSKVIRYGIELHGQYRATNSIILGCSGDYIYSRQVSGVKKGYTLPFSPPASLLFSFRYEPRDYRIFSSPYVSLDYKLVAAQNRIVPPEEKTAGYQLAHFQMGAEIKTNRFNLNLSVQIQNLFNTKYFNHTSYYRLINAPEPGRNIVLNINIPFTGVCK